MIQMHQPSETDFLMHLRPLSMLLETQMYNEWRAWGGCEKNYCWLCEFGRMQRQGKDPVTVPQITWTTLVLYCVAVGRL